MTSLPTGFAPGRAASRLPSVDILWTGGFDSTFRVACLSRLPVAIHPFYVVSPRRRSSPFERAAIDKTTALLQDHPDTRCTFGLLEILEKDAIPGAPTVSAAFDRLRQKAYLGTQYVCLASLAASRPGIELTVHKDDKAIDMIKRFGRLQRVDDSITGPYFILDKSSSDPDLAAVFGNFRFPIADRTKLEMRQWYVDNGYSAVMDATWFCYNPTNGKPCGHCPPCRYTIEEGLSSRFTRLALFRYALHHSRPSIFVKNLLKTRFPALARHLELQ